MLSSLRARLAMAALLVAGTAVVITAVAVQRVTESDIRSSIQRDLDTELFIRDSLAFYSFDTGSWDGVATEVRSLSQDTGQRIAVATLAGEILADSEQLLFNRAAPLPDQAFILDPDSSLFGFDVGPEELALVDAQTQVMTTCLDLVEVGYSLVLDETFGIEIVVPDLAVSPEQANRIADCLGEAEFEGDFLWPSGDIEFADADSDALTDGFDVEPLQLFVGYGDNAPGGVFSPLRSAGFWVAVGSVLAVTAAVAGWVATRLARPIGSLTTAALRMSAGDLSARVDINGSDEIGQLGAAFNEMAGSLQAEDQARRTLTTDVAHELRSPLANLRGYIEAIQDRVVQPDDATIDSLHDETTILQTLVQDLQQLSLAEAGGLTLHRVPTNVGDLIERVVGGHQANAANAQIELSASSPLDLELTVDPDRIRQVLTNLVGNALRHSDPGDTVTVSLSVGPESVKIRVADTGAGIEAEHLPHIFDRFYRADSARSRATGGSGLGLAITRALVQAHGGTIEVASTLDQGTTFTIALPR